MATVLLTACQDGPLSRAELARDDAAALRLPGADELGAFGGERQQTLDGQQGAFDGHVFGTMASSAEVRAFYTRELERLGWKTEGSSRGISTVEIEAWWWCKPKEIVRVGVKDASRAFEPSFLKGKTYVTVFDAALMANYSGVSACP